MMATAECCGCYLLGACPGRNGFGTSSVCRARLLARPGTARRVAGWAIATQHRGGTTHLDRSPRPPLSRQFLQPLRNTHQLLVRPNPCGPTPAWSDRWFRCDDRYALGFVLRYLQDLAQSNVSRERQYAIKWLKRLPNDPGFVYRKFIVDRVDEAIFDISSSISDFETGGALHSRAVRDIPETPPHR